MEDQVFVESIPILVQAKYGFDGRNNDELTFRKNDLITLTQKIEGGWWEGTLRSKTGWFPSDYVLEVWKNENCLRLKSSSRIGDELFSIPEKNQYGFREQVLIGFLDSERLHVSELKTLFHDYLKPIERENVLSIDDYEIIVNNIEAIIQQQFEILTQIEQSLKLPSPQQKIGGALLSLAPNMKSLICIYSENHPKAIETINENREKLNSFFVRINGSMKFLISSLSQPFRHLDKYASTLQELERIMELDHPDRGDTQRAVSVYRDLATHCLSIRKQKEMQMELMSTGLISQWDDDDKTIHELGSIVYMGTVSVINEDDEQHPVDECCLVAFPSVLLVLEITSQHNCYILKRRLSLDGAVVSRKPDSGSFNTLYISGPTSSLLMSTDQLHRWLTALAACHRVSLHESCNGISPTTPHAFHVGNVMQTELSPCKQPQVSILPAPTQADVMKKSTTLPAMFDHQLGMVMPESDQRLEKNGNTDSNCRPRMYSGFCLRPFPAVRGNYAVDFGKKSAVKLRRNVPSTDEEDLLVFGAIEAYCYYSSASSSSPFSSSLATSKLTPIRSSFHSSPQLIVAENEKIFVEETVDDRVVLKERSLVDTVYALKDQVGCVQKVGKYWKMHDNLDEMMKTMEKEQKARRRMEELLRRFVICPNEEKRPSSLIFNGLAQVVD